MVTEVHADERRVVAPEVAEFESRRSPSMSITLEDICPGELGYPCWHKRGHQGAHHWPPVEAACEECLPEVIYLAKQSKARKDDG